MSAISVFNASNRNYVEYLGDVAKPEKGNAKIARLVGPSNSSSIGGGVVIYERVMVDWDLLSSGDVAWFPARTPLTYEVPERVVVSYAIYPIPQAQPSEVLKSSS